MLAADKFEGKKHFRMKYAETSCGRANLDTNVRLDLSRMYKLFSRVPAGLNEMRTAISKYIVRLGAEINNSVHADLPASSSKPKAPSDKAAPPSIQTANRWVEQILELQEKFDRILERAARKDKSFQTAFNEVGHLSRYYAVPHTVLHSPTRLLSNSLMRIQSRLNLFHCILTRTSRKV